MNISSLKEKIYYKIAILLFKIFFVSFIVIYVGGQFVTAIVPMEDFVDWVDQTTGTDSEWMFSTEEDEEDTSYSIEGIDKYIDDDFYRVYYGITSAAAIIGTVILSRMRNVFETMGLLLAFVIPAKRKSWGTILDKKTKKAIPFSIVRLYTEKPSPSSKLGNEGDNKERKTIETVTDMDGKYRIHVEKTSPEYRLEVRASGYNKYESKVEYIDDPFEGGNFIADIYLSRETGAEHKTRNNIRYLRPKLYWYVMLAMYFFSIIYFIFSIYYLLAYPGSLYSYINIALYIFAVSWNTKVVKERLKPSGGRFLDYETKKSVPDVNVQLYKNGKQIERQNAGRNGTIKFNCEGGVYDLRISKLGYRLENGKTFLEIKINDEGHLEKDVLLKSGSANQPKSSTEKSSGQEKEEPEQESLTPFA